MRVTRYRSSQRLRVELVEGASVRETIRDLAHEHEGLRVQVRGTGRIDAVRLEGASEPSVGLVEVVDLTNDGETLRLVGRAADGTVVAGAIVDARAVELVLDVELLEPVEEARGRIQSKQDAPPSWAAVAAATKARDDEEAAEPVSPTPEVGDRVEHGTFGACTVEKIDADEEFIMVRSANQRLLRLSLDVLRLELVGEADGVRSFRARPARPAAKGR